MKFARTLIYFLSPLYKKKKGHKFLIKLSNNSLIFSSLKKSYIFNTIVTIYCLLEYKYIGNNFMYIYKVLKINTHSNYQIYFSKVSKYENLFLPVNYH